MPTSSSGAEATVERFDLTERLLHWAFAIPFLFTLATGLGLYFQGLEKLVGDRELVRNLHRVSGVLTILLPLLVVAFGNRRSLARDVDEVDRWSDNDRRWFRAWLWRKVGGRDRLPPQGRFNAGQKFNAVITAAAVFWLTVTGVALFPPLSLPFWLVSNARNLHNLAWILLLPAVLGHVYLAAVYRPTRPGLPGIIGGRVPREWLAEHHPLALEAREAGRDPGPGPTTLS